MRTYSHRSESFPADPTFDREISPPISPPLNVSGIVVDYGEDHDAEAVLRVLGETVTPDGSPE